MPNKDKLGHSNSVSTFGPRDGPPNMPSTGTRSPTSSRRRHSSGSSSGHEGREMVGGCCVCSDERGWDENPLVYCDGQGCNVAVHQACYGIVSVPTGPWFCRKCESQERAARVRCELCPSKEGALKRTDTSSWAHVVCALYIPEVRFGNVSTMEPIVLSLIPQDRFQKICYLCETQGRENRAASGACMQCNRAGCKQSFHVTCAQSAGLLCEEAGNYMDNVKYCGYCEYHYQRINKRVVKTIPAFKPIKPPNQASATSPESSPEKSHHHKDKDGASSQSRDSKKASKKGRKSFGSSGIGSSSSGSEVKIEAAKFVPESSTDSRKESTSSSSASTNGGNPEPDRPRSNESSVKPPVVLKFGKQDNGTLACFNKETTSSPNHRSSSTSSSPSRSGSGSSKKDHHKSHHRNSSSSSSSNKEHRRKEHLQRQSSGEASNDGHSETTDKTDQDRKSNSRNEVKVEAMEVDSPLAKSSSDKDLALSALKSSCSVTLDKSKVDQSLPPSKEDSSDKDKTNNLSSATTASNSKYSGVQLTALPPETSKEPVSGPDSFKEKKVEPDTSNVTITAATAIVKPEVTSPEAMGPPSSVATASVVPSAATVAPKEEFVISASTGKMPRISAAGKRIGRPPKKGTHLPHSSMSQIRSQSSDGTPDGPLVKRKRKSPTKKDVNGSSAESTPWMMGATLNPSSNMAKEMSLALEDEKRTHAAFDPNKANKYLGVPFLGARRKASQSEPQPHNANDILAGGKSQPQTLEELLERQWEQGSQFLMEQASHFDIASLLSSLHQLKEENVDLEDSVDKLVQRRDHLLAVRARLMALSSLSVGPAANAVPNDRGPGYPPQQNGPSHPAARNSALVSPRGSGSSTVSPMQHQRGPGPLPSPRGGGQPHPQQQHPMMITSPREQRALPGPPPPPSRDSRMSPRGPVIENGIDFHHQQQMAAAAAHQAARDRDRMMSGHLLAVVSSASSRGLPSVHAPAHSRQAPYHPPLSGAPPHPGMGPPTTITSQSRPLPSHPTLPPQHQVMRGPPGHPSQGLPPHHYNSGAGDRGQQSHYQMVSPPPSHSSMVTLDRSSQQHLRNPPSAHPAMRMDKR